MKVDLSLADQQPIPKQADTLTSRESYKNRDAKAVYSRFKEKGRMVPDGLKYVGSWVEDNFDRCFQLMECDDPRLFQQWLVHWEDLGDFEIVHVVLSAEAADAALSGRDLPRLEP